MRIGRPIAITHRETVLLERALQNGISVAEACRYAGVSRTTYYAEYGRSEAFAEAMERAKGWLIMRARLTVADAIANKHDVKMAAWYLERRDPTYRK